MILRLALKGSLPRRRHSAMVLILAGLGGVLAPTYQASSQSCDEGGAVGGPDDTRFACGNNSYANGAFTAATGTEARASGIESSAYGHHSHSMSQGVAVGAYAKAGVEYLPGEGPPFGAVVAYATGATAIGMGSQAGLANGANEATALGHSAQANAAYATTLGAQSKANFTGSTAIGHGVETTRENQVLIGNGNNTYTLAGINSAASKSAQSGTTYMVTSDANGNLATSTFDVTALQNLPARMTTAETNITNLQSTVNNHTTTLNSHTFTLADHETRITQTEVKNVEQDDRLDQHDITLNQHTLQITDLGDRVTVNEQNINLLDNRVTNLEAGFQDLGNQISENRKEARGGTALALATAGLRYDDRPEKLSIAGGVGHFKGLTGLSFGVGYNTSESLRFNAAISGIPQNGDMGFSAGASWTLN